MSWSDGSMWDFFQKEFNKDQEIMSANLKHANIYLFIISTYMATLLTSWENKIKINKIIKYNKIIQEHDGTQGQFN